MLKKVPKMCVTCRFYEPYYCTRDDSYIGYLYCDVTTKCKAYSLSDDYRRGGKFYESRKMDGERRESE